MMRCHQEGRQSTSHRIVAYKSQDINEVLSHHFVSLDSDWSLRSEIFANSELPGATLTVNAGIKFSGILQNAVGASDYERCGFPLSFLENALGGTEWDFQTECTEYYGAEWPASADKNIKLLAQDCVPSTASSSGTGTISPIWSTGSDKDSNASTTSGEMNGTSKPGSKMEGTGTSPEVKAAIISSKLGRIAVIVAVLIMFHCVRKRKIGNQPLGNSFHPLIEKRHFWADIWHHFWPLVGKAPIPPFLSKTNILFSWSNLRTVELYV